MGEWISLQERQPNDYETVYLRCEYMFVEYTTKGSLVGNKRYESEVDEDLFFRSRILGWKPIN